MTTPRIITRVKIVAVEMTMKMVKPTIPDCDSPSLLIHIYVTVSLFCCDRLLLANRVCDFTHVLFIVFFFYLCKYELYVGLDFLVLPSRFSLDGLQDQTV